MRAVSRRYGPELARSIAVLIDENRHLKLKLQRSMRSQAKLQAESLKLGGELREKEIRMYAERLSRDNLFPPGTDCCTEASQVVPFLQTSLDPEAGAVDSTREEKQYSEGTRRESEGRNKWKNAVRQYCTCTEKLQELLDCIDDQIVDYERGVWQQQVNVLEDERNSLMMK